MKKTILYILTLIISLTSYAHNKGLEYLENKGQWEEKVLYRANMGGGTVFLEEDGFTFSMRSGEDMRLAHDNQHKGIDTEIHGHAWKLQFLNTTGPEKVEAKEKNSPYYNFFIGHDLGKWQSFVGSYQEVLYTNLWPGIDLKVYSNSYPKGSNFKYDFIVHPGADASLIRWEYLGLDGVKLVNEELLLKTSIGTFTEAKPSCFQQNTFVEAKYACAKNIYNFVFTNGYNTNQKLIIDPELIAATFVGAEMHLALGVSATYNLMDEILGGSIAYGNTSLPNTLGSFSENYNGGIMDMGISKFSPDGSDLLWSTYLGGDSTDKPISIICNSLNEIYVLGNTTSPNFPVSEGALRENKDGEKCNVVFKLSNDGANLVASTFVAGVNPEIASVGFAVENGWGILSTFERGEIILDENENPVIATHTNSDNFPLSDNAYQSERKGVKDGAVASFNTDLSELIWGTLVGGDGHDYFVSVRINDNGEIVLTGSEYSLCSNCEHYPTTSNAYQEYPTSYHDGFITILTNDASNLIYSTYTNFTLSSSFFVELDSEDHIWICGMSQEPVPLVGDAFFTAPSSTYIAKFSPDLSTLEICTMVGVGFHHEEIIAPSAFMIDNCDRIYMSANSNGFALDSVAITEDAFQDHGGFYLAQYAPEMGELLYATLMGGDHTDGGHSRFDKKGVVYQAVCSSLNGYPGTLFEALPNAWDTQQGEGVSFELAVFKIDFESDATVSQFGYDIQGLCAPLDVQFNNYSTDGDYTWILDGSEFSSEEAPIITFENGGQYQVQLITTNDESCNISDTTFLNIEIPEPLQMQTSWNINPVDLCADSLVIQASFTGNNQESLLWEFEGGSTSDESIDLLYTENGTYPISLTAYDEECEFSDSLEIVFDYDPLHSSWDITSSDPCADTLFIFGNYTGIGEEDLYWNYYNDTSSENEIELVYTNQGNYFIELIAFDENCQEYDTLSVSFPLQGTVEVSASAEFYEGCEPLTVQLNGENNIGTAFWQTPQGIFNTNNPQITFDEEGVYNLVYIAEDDFSCNQIDSTEIEIIVHPSLVTSMEINPISPSPCDDELFVQFEFTGENESSIVWETGDGETISGSSLSHTYSYPGTFTITLTAENELCQQEESLSEIIEVVLNAPEFTEMFFPNVISPNNDGLNDYLEFNQLGNITDSSFELFELSIFNRWGNLVFQSNSPTSHWDGSINGEPVSNGAYFYTLHYQRACTDEVVQDVSGSFEVLR